MNTITTKIRNRLRTNWIQLRPVKPAKVIGIGLPKTGTTSLGYCFRRFGYKHRTFDMDLALQVKRNQLDGVLKEAEKYEAFEDWPWFAIYKELEHKRTEMLGWRGPREAREAIRLGRARYLDSRIAEAIETATRS